MMKRKIMCISMIGLLLLTGVASFSVASESTEQKTPVVNSQSDVAKITVKGGILGIRVKVVPDESIQNSGYLYSIRIQFNDEPALRDSGGLGSSPARYSTGLLFQLRMSNLLNSRSGTVHVVVEILDGNPGYVVQEVEKTGNFRGPFVTI